MNNRGLPEYNLEKVDIEMDVDSILRRVHGGKHHMGNTRIHIDSNQGDVDENCKVHGINNLSVSGSLVSPMRYSNYTL